MKNIRLSLSVASTLFALAATPLLGCATNEEAEPVVTDPSAPIATIPLESGNELQFFEPSPGLLLVSELGTAGIAPVHIDGKNPIDLYRQLAPGRDVPRILLDAQARSEKLPADAQPNIKVSSSDAKDSVASLVETGPRNYINNQSCDDQWFNNTFCVGSYDWSACRLNLVGNWWASHSSADYAHFAVCADIGNVTMDVSMGDGSGGIWTVTEGTYRTWSWSDPCVFGCNKSARLDVTNATNDRFHASMRVNN
jgi:hypothetical protein